MVHKHFGLLLHLQKAREIVERVDVMTVMLYQAKAGDGFKKKGMKRTDTFFKTPQEAVSEALALKEKMDKTYKNEIHWDYNREISGKTDKLKILKGYLNGDRDTNPFYLEILCVKQLKTISTKSPIKVKKMSKDDKIILKTVVSMYN